jgi:hypothetical protein
MHETIVAGFVRFYRRDVRRELILERFRAPFLPEPEGDTLQSWLEDIPRAIWIDGVLALSDDPSQKIVRRLFQSHLSQIPRTMLVICPIWTKRLF